MAWPFVCGRCKRSYSAEQWLGMTFVCRYETLDGDADMRTCACGCSHSVLVSDLPANVRTA